VPFDAIPGCSEVYSLGGSDGIVRTPWHGASFDRLWAGSWQVIARLNRTSSSEVSVLQVDTGSYLDVRLMANNTARLTYSGGSITTGTMSPTPASGYWWYRVRVERNVSGARRVTVWTSSTNTDNPASVVWGPAVTGTNALTGELPTDPSPTYIGLGGQSTPLGVWARGRYQIQMVAPNTPTILADVDLTNDLWPPEVAPSFVVGLEPAALTWEVPHTSVDDVNTTVVMNEIISCHTLGTLAPAESGAVAYGPYDVSPEGLVHLPFEVRVVEHDNPGNVLVNLDTAFDASFQEPLSEPGAGTFTLYRHDPALQWVTADRLVQFLLYGQATFLMRPEVIEEGVITSSEEATENVKVMGSQHIRLLDEAVVYPAGGPDRRPMWDDRAFNWTAPDSVYDASGWDHARKLVTQGGAGPWTGNPKGWPGGGDWIGPPTRASTTLAPPGRCYYRSGPGKFQTSAEVEQVCVFMSSDNEGDLYLDGNLILANQNGHIATAFTFLDITPGAHTLAASVLNYAVVTTAVEADPLMHVVVAGETLQGLAGRYYSDGRRWNVIYEANRGLIKSMAQQRGRWYGDVYNDEAPWIYPGAELRIPGFSPYQSGTPPTNPTGLLVVVYPAKAQVITSRTPVFRTTAAYWLCAPYPPSPPGMTVGRVVRVLLEEAQRRGALEGVTLDFTDEVDSDGKSWDPVSDIVTKVGTDYLTFLAKELAETYADFWMHPAQRRLSAWRKGTRGVVVPGVSFHGPDDPARETTSNLAHLSILRSL
jgi:LysM domain